MDVLREITPLSAEDCFIVMQRPRMSFSNPLHVHPELELNYVENANGALRIVDESVEEINDLDLVLIGGGSKHSYSDHKCRFNGVTEITVQFQRSLLDSLIDKRHFRSIREMFDNAVYGLVFSSRVVQQVSPKLKTVSKDINDSFQTFLLLLDILKTLSLDGEVRRLNAAGNVSASCAGETDRLKSIMHYLYNNYHHAVTLSQISFRNNMSEASLNRFLKKWTGKTFIDNLNEIRIAEAASRLIDTSDSIAEICYKSGFNNLSNFNRAFKKRKGYTPTEYREKYFRSRFRI